jgi:hypothetical protein
MLQIEKGNKCEDWNPSNSDFIGKNASNEKRKSM